MVSKYIPFIVVPFLIVITIAMIVGIVKEKTECDQVIFLEGELSMDVSDVNSYENGMSTIHLCDGKTVRVPTRRIIKIIDKDVQ
jgi:hypothetical protein